MKKTTRMKCIPGLLAVFFVVTVLMVPAQAEIIKKPLGGSIWTPFPGDFPFTPAFPDPVSRYDTFVFKPDTGDFDILKVTGRFPYARYFSFNLYEFVEATDIAAYADNEITPDPGSVNPCLVGQDRSATNRNYTLWLVKEGVPVPRDARNVMILPSGVETLSLFTRIYRPDQGYDTSGGVPLPTIEALKADLSSGKSPEFGLDMDSVFAKLPDLVLNKSLLACHEFGRKFSGNTIVFHRISDAGFYPNAHNEYIVAALPADYLNKVAVITFTPPTFEETYTGDCLEGGKDVRYWSFCIGGLGETRTTNGICDDQAVRNPDGTVTVCIAPSTLKNKIKAAGYNFIAWGVAYKPILIHRHMLAAESFAGSISHVPAIARPPAPEDWNQAFFDDNSAVRFMGEYAPTGRVYTVLEFLRWLRKK